MVAKIILFLKKNYLYIVGFILFLLFAGNCANNEYQRSEAERKLLKKELSVLKDSLKIDKERRIAEEDSIVKEQVKRNKRVIDAEKRAKESEKRVAILEEQNNINKQRIAKLNYIESAKEINEVYNTTNAVATDVSVNLHKDLPNLVLQTISDVNVCQDVIEEKDIQLVESKTIIKEKDASIADGVILLNSAKNSLKLAEETQAKTDETLKKTQKSLGLKKVTGVLKTIAIPAAFIGGFLLAK